MPRETIASVKKWGATRLREFKAEHETAIDKLVRAHADEAAALRAQIAAQDRDLTEHRRELGQRADEITDLKYHLDNARGEVRLREQEVRLLEHNLSDAARVIATLGRRRVE